MPEKRPFPSNKKPYLPESIKTTGATKAAK